MIKFYTIGQLKPGGELNLAHKRSKIEKNTKTHMWRVSSCSEWI
jgi:hypothetical protein